MPAVGMTAAFVAGIGLVSTRASGGSRRHSGRGVRPAAEDEEDEEREEEEPGEEGGGVGSGPAPGEAGASAAPAADAARDALPGGRG
ncbi:MAG: hypothetical protein MUC63_05875 [Planctomycetes bacterium]|nr:hypothetical protein [Planctomycetota bacterium]